MSTALQQTQHSIPFYKVAGSVLNIQLHYLAESLHCIHTVYSDLWKVGHPWYMIYFLDSTGSMGMAKGIALFSVTPSSFFFFAIFSTSNKNLKTQIKSVRTSSPPKTKPETESWSCVWVPLLSRSDSQTILLFSGPADRNKQSKLSMSKRINPVIPASCKHCLHFHNCLEPIFG